MERGQNKLVLRIWLAGARWWNLHQNDPHSALELANQEIQGYRWARHAFLSLTGRWDCKTESDQQQDHLQEQQKHKLEFSTDVYIPQVLYYSHDDQVDSQKSNNGDNTNRHTTNPWALLEYVGPSSTVFNDNSFIWDDSYQTTMIPIRHEFGFDEPHPRWGRIPIDQALDYGYMVIDQVLVPLHIQSSRSFFEFLSSSQHEPLHIRTKDDTAGTTTAAASLVQRGQDNSTSNTNVPRGIQYSDMVPIYQQAWDRMIHQYCQLQKQTYPCNTDNNGEQQRYHDALNELQKAIQQLQEYAKTIPPWPPVLVHLDLQPQNIFMTSQKVQTMDINHTTTTKTTKTTAMIMTTKRNDALRARPTKLQRIRTVLDWEDATWADPRFDLLLMGRKVMANYNQAELLWNWYEIQWSNYHDNNHQKQQQQQQEQQQQEEEQEEEASHSEPSLSFSSSSSPGTQKLGNMEPWLYLETTHSVTTLLLQSMNLLGGGRNPWETSLDLWGKVERELIRLQRYQVQTGMKTTMA